MHQLIHDEGGTSHIARVFHERDESIEDENLGEEDNDCSHTAYHTIDKEVFQLTLREECADAICDPLDEPAETVHGILTQDERTLEHHKE